MQKKRRCQSDEHFNIVNKIGKMFGIEFKEEGMIKGGYYPDVKFKDVEIEVESLSKISQYKRKSSKWNKKKKRILVVFVPKEIRDKFDAVTFWQCDKTF